jgi:hypothetical protein
MIATSSARLPRWYWAAAGAAALWALVGCGAYLMQVSMGPEDLARLPADQQAVWRETPRWIMAFYAIATWSGLVGAVGLLMRRAWARHAFLVSALGVAAQFTASIATTTLLARLGYGSLAFPLLIFAVVAAQYWLAHTGTRRGWLR